MPCPVLDVRLHAQDVCHRDRRGLLVMGSAKVPSGFRIPATSRLEEGPDEGQQDGDGDEPTQPMTLFSLPRAEISLR